MVKLRQQGSSVVVTIPAAVAKNLNLDSEYSVKLDDNGTITLIPKLINPFLHGQPGEFYEKDLWEDMKPGGNEI